MKYTACAATALVVAVRSAASTAAKRCRRHAAGAVQDRPKGEREEHQQRDDEQYAGGADQGPPIGNDLEDRPEGEHPAGWDGCRTIEIGGNRIGAAYLLDSPHLVEEEVQPRSRAGQERGENHGTGRGGTDREHCPVPIGGLRLRRSARVGLLVGL